MMFSRIFERYAKTCRATVPKVCPVFDSGLRLPPFGLSSGSKTKGGCRRKDAQIRGEDSSRRLPFRVHPSGSVEGKARPEGLVEKATLWGGMPVHKYAYARPANCGTHIHTKIPAPMGNNNLSLIGEGIQPCQ